MNYPAQQLAIHICKTAQLPWERVKELTLRFDARNPYIELDVKLITFYPDNSINTVFEQYILTASKRDDEQDPVDDDEDDDS